MPPREAGVRDRPGLLAAVATAVATLVTERRQRFGDLLAGTVVVRTRDREDG